MGKYSDLLKLGVLLLLCFFPQSLWYSATKYSENHILAPFWPNPRWVWVGGGAAPCHLPHILDSIYYVRIRTEVQNTDSVGGEGEYQDKMANMVFKHLLYCRAGLSGYIDFLESIWKLLAPFSSPKFNNSYGVHTPCLVFLFLSLIFKIKLFNELNTEILELNGVCP